MRRPSKQGFTLIELLVVISIIGILASLLFPVYSRSRESARKTQCLANIKNIALAVNMYLVDYDRLPPRETRSEVLAYFISGPGGGGPVSREFASVCATQANPYLRWAVILEEYVKNREVWRCPNARLITGAQWIVPRQDWLGYEQETAGRWGCQVDVPEHGWGHLIGPCQWAWPGGWGGDVTDSIVQQEICFVAHRDMGHRAFQQTIAVAEPGWGINLGAVQDPGRAVVCADGGAQILIYVPALLAYPDLCKLDCGRGVDCCASDWGNCPSSRGCSVPVDKKHEFLMNPEARKPYARHMGGSNIGFMDGHAKWYAAEAILNGLPPKGDQFLGVGQACGHLARGCPKF